MNGDGELLISILFPQSDVIFFFSEVLPMFDFRSLFIHLTKVVSKSVISFVDDNGFQG